MRTLPVLAFLLAAGSVVAADEFKLEPGYTLLFDGKNLSGWQTKAAGKDAKAEPLDGKTEAFGGRFKVADGELAIDPKVKGDRYIETVAPVSGDFTIRFDFKPADGCNNDLLLLGTKFDIKVSSKDTLKGAKAGEWNKLEIVVKAGSADFIINGEKAATQKTKAAKGPFTLRAEFGAIAYRNLRITSAEPK